MFGIGPPELLVIFLIILILFGAKRLPELARSLGRSINEFKNATQNIKNELDVTKEDSPKEKRVPEEKKETGKTNSNSESLGG